MTSKALISFWVFSFSSLRDIGRCHLLTFTQLHPVIKVYYCLKKEEKGELHKAFKGRTNTESDDKCNPAVSRKRVYGRRAADSV